MNILDYLGKPWANGESGPDAFDCWGMVRAVYRDRGIDLPVVDVDAHKALDVRHAFNADEHLSRWEKIAGAVPFCAVLMSKATRPDHVGVWLSDNGGGVLHSTQNAGVILSNKMALRMMGWNVLGFYAWKG